MRSISLSKRALSALTSALIVALSPSVTASEAEAPEPISVVSQFAGTEPERCVFASAGQKVCSWSLDGRLIGPEAPDAPTLALNLICEVSIDSQSAGEPRCEVHPVGLLTPALPPVGAGGSENSDLRVLAGVASATTTTEISWAMGAIPAQCRSASGAQRCDWSLPTEGRAGKDAVLRCELPLDGTPRADGSCQIVERSADAS
jgi:hypothetical protein